MTSDRMSLAGALASRYPESAYSQRERLEAALIRELAAAIGRGDLIGTIRPMADGSFEIRRFAVQGDRQR
jgi:hypothetical protein